MFTSKVHVDFHVTVEIVEELDRLLAIRRLIDSETQKGASPQVKAYTELEKGQRKQVDGLNLKKYVKIFMTSSCINPNGLSVLKPTSRKTKHGKARKAMDEKEYELIQSKNISRNVMQLTKDSVCLYSEITMRAWPGVPDDKIVDAIRQALTNTRK